MKLTVGVTTRDRPDALSRCLDSIARHLAGAEVIVFDDASVRPVRAHAAGVRVIEDRTGPGYIAGRNAIVAAASHDLVLLLDDDAVVLDGDAVRGAIDVVERDPRVGAVAFAQAEADGRPWPEAMQPARGTAAAYVPSFIGFAHLLRRDLFLRLGGYRAEFVFYGEEKDYCLRMLAAGSRVVYLPDARIAHLPDAAGRDSRRYVRYVIRNDCLGALYNVPWPVAVVDVPVRLWRYGRMAASIEGGDPGGFSWLLGELRRALPRIRTRRRNVGWTTLREWRRLARHAAPYPGLTSDG
jgi:GT2 family glycosyltransferase